MFDHLDTKNIENDKKFWKKYIYMYISPEKKQQTTDDLRLIK